MNKFWRIALNEYKKHAMQKRFILTLLGLPLLLSAMVGMIFIMVKLGNIQEPIGLVDLSQSIDPRIEIIEAADLEYPIDVISFENEAIALKALQEEHIQAIFILPINYPESIEVDVIYINEPGDNAFDQIRYLLKSNILAEYPLDVKVRGLEGFSPIIRTPDGLREFSQKNTLNLVLPLVSGVVFMFLILLSANYFSSFVAEEKENRTMEILTTTVSPNQLIAGKIFGTIAVVLTQLMSWIILFIIAWQISKQQINAEWIQNPHIEPSTLLTILVILIPAYILYAALISTVGAAATNVQEGQQIAGIFVMPLSLSYMLLALIIENPNSPFAVAVSLFPLTAPTLMPLRIALTVVPPEQIILCATVLIICALIAIWMAARAFELGLLRYGKKLRIREIFSKNAGMNT